MIFFQRLHCKFLVMDYVIIFSQNLKKSEKMDTLVKSQKVNFVSKRPQEYFSHIFKGLNLRKHFVRTEGPKKAVGYLRVKTLIVAHEWLFQFKESVGRTMRMQWIF